MDPFFFLSTIGVVPSTSTKPAVTMLMLSLFVTFSDLAEPFWLSGFLPIVIFAGLVILDLFIGSEGAVIDFIQPFMPIIKVILTMILVFAMFIPELATLTMVINGEMIPWWAVAIRWIWTGIIGVLAWYASLYRNAFQLFVMETDEDDDIGLLSLHGWSETLFAGINTILFIYYPLMSVVLFIFTAVGLWALRAYLDMQEEKKRIACHHCGANNYGSALICTECGTESKTPLRIGLLGQTSSNYVTNRDKQRWDLVAQKRCPQCATKLKERTVTQVCECCKKAVLDTPEALREYIKYYERQLPATLIICAALGLIPFFGVVAAVLYYRLTLISPMRRYVPKVQGCFARWGIRLLNIVLVSFQPIPIMGAIIMSAMCYLNFQVYRTLLVQSQFKQA